MTKNYSFIKMAMLNWPHKANVEIIAMSPDYISEKTALLSTDDAKKALNWFLSSIYKQQFKVSRAPYSKYFFNKHLPKRSGRINSIPSSFAEIIERFKGFSLVPPRNRTLPALDRIFAAINLSQNNKTIEQILADSGGLMKTNYRELTDEEWKKTIRVIIKIWRRWRIPDSKLSVTEIKQIKSEYKMKMTKLFGDNFSYLLKPRMEEFIALQHEKIAEIFIYENAERIPTKDLKNFGLFNHRWIKNQILFLDLERKMIASDFALEILLLLSLRSLGCRTLNNGLDTDQAIEIEAKLYYCLSGWYRYSNRTDEKYNRIDYRISSLDKITEKNISDSDSQNLSIADIIPAESTPYLDYINKEEELERRESVKKMKKAIKLLSKEDQQIINEIYFNNKTPLKISQEKTANGVKISRQAIEQRLKTARLRLKKLMK